MTHVSRAVRAILKSQPAVPITPVTFPSKTVFPVKVMRCDVVFGSPSMDCNGTGICKITGTSSIRPHQLKKDCQSTIAYVAAASNDQISLFFFREFLCIHLYLQHFRKGVLVMKEACTVPADIFNRLKINGKTLLSGRYAVVKCDGYFRVDIACA